MLILQIIAKLSREFKHDLNDPNLGSTDLFK